MVRVDLWFSLGFAESVLLCCCAFRQMSRVVYLHITVTQPLLEPLYSEAFQRVLPTGDMTSK